MKKKTLAMMLMTTLLLGSILTACSSNNAANGSNQTAANEATVSPEATASTEPTSTTEPIPSVTPSNTTTPSAVPTANAESKPSTTAKPTKEPAPSKKPTTNKPSSTAKPSHTPAPTKKPTPTKAPAAEKMPSASDMIDGMLEEVEQPSLMTMDSDMMKDAYAIDSSLLEEYSIRFPMMNIKATEIAIFKVKKEKDIDAVKEGIEKRAGTIQKQFETYLPDQYENAKNYKVVTNGNYVLFIISESADDLEKAFNSYFDKKK